jgi:hypothetical protein
MTTKVQTSVKTGKPDIPADLVTDITEHIADRHSTLSADDRLIIALWIMHTYLYQHCETIPYLHIAAITPDAGKTEIAHILNDLSFAAQIVWPTVSRMSTFTDSGKHTMILDQIEHLVNSRAVDQDAFNSLVNHGNRPGVLWQVSGAPDRIAFFPKAFLGIGPGILRDALASRSIRIIVRPGNETDQDTREARQTIRPVVSTAIALKTRIESACKSTAVHTALKQSLTDKATRTLNDGRALINRNAQIYRPLIALADMVSPECGKQMREIAACKTDIEPESVPTPAEQIDTIMRTAMREKRLSVSSWLGASKRPLYDTDNYAITNDDLGYPRTRNSFKGILPEGSLIVSDTEHSAELRFKASEFSEICAGLKLRATDVKAAYKDANRLHAVKDRTNIRTSFRQGQGDICLIAIDVSIWLWPDKVSIPNSSAHIIGDWNQ